jgi:flagellar hook-basal body complex protein FliE
MPISGIEIGKPYRLATDTESTIKPTSTPAFSDMLRDFIEDVNTLQLDSKHQTERLIRGEPVELHDVMIAAEKAKTSFELLLELRNKALDLYREITRTQI